MFSPSKVQAALKAETLVGSFVGSMGTGLGILKTVQGSSNTHLVPTDLPGIVSKCRFRVSRSGEKPETLHFSERPRAHGTANSRLCIKLNGPEERSRHLD